MVMHATTSPRYVVGIGAVRCSQTPRRVRTVVGPVLSELVSPDAVDLERALGTAHETGTRRTRDG